MDVARGRSRFADFSGIQWDRKIHQHPVTTNVVCRALNALTLIFHFCEICTVFGSALHRVRHEGIRMGILCASRRVPAGVGAHLNRLLNRRLEVIVPGLKLPFTQCFHFFRHCCQSVSRHIQQIQ